MGVEVMWTRGNLTMIKLDFWKKKRRREEAPEPMPWQQQQPIYDHYQDTTRSSLFTGDDDWDVTGSRPVFSTQPDGRSRSYEDFLRARNQTRPWDNPYGGNRDRRFGYYDDEEEEQGLPVRRAMQIVGAVALVGVLYLTFQSESPMAQKVTAFVKQSMTQDTNVAVVSSWWKDNVTDKVAVPTTAPAQETPKPVESFVMPVTGTVKTAYDGKDQQGVTLKAAAGAEIKAAGGGMIEKVEEDAKDDFSVTINHGSSGRTIYSQGTLTKENYGRDQAKPMGRRNRTARHLEQKRGERRTVLRV